ncbi:MAG: hypothetical protein M0R48_06330 [Candidatus Omnitrophica bacterium]|jgi:hypothetical protein|nr:hypothetical protein [Candidatus Omnitrophota bacterium]
MNYKIKRSITRESILFLVFLTGILLITLAPNYKTIAIAEQSSKSFFSGKLFVVIPDGISLPPDGVNDSYVVKYLFLHKLGLTLLFLYLLYLIIRFISWAARRIRAKYSKNLTKGGLSMSIWAKQNWFKLGVLLSFFIISLSVAYYFVLFLPRSQEFPAKSVSKSSTEIMELENKCFLAASDFFKENGFNPKNCGFQNHYNSKLNKCFINIKSAKMEEGGRLSFHKLLYDVYNRKKYGEYSWKPEDGKNYWEVKPSICFTLDKSCRAVEDYESFAKEYMEE